MDYVVKPKYVEPSDKFAVKSLYARAAAGAEPEAQAALAAESLSRPATRPPVRLAKRICQGFAFNRLRAMARRVLCRRPRGTADLDPQPFPTLTRGVPFLVVIAALAAGTLRAMDTIRF